MEKYYDFNFRVKNFSAIDVIDSRDLRLYENVTYRNGINKTSIDKLDFKNFMIYNLDYMDIISDENEISDLCSWLKFSQKTKYSITFSNVDKKVLEAKIRIFDIDLAFKFKLQFYDYIIGGK